MNLPTGRRKQVRRCQLTDREQASSVNNGHIDSYQMFQMARKERIGQKWVFLIIFGYRLSASRRAKRKRKENEARRKYGELRSSGSVPPASLIIAGWWRNLAQVRLQCRSRWKSEVTQPRENLLSCFRVSFGVLQFWTNGSAYYSLKSTFRIAPVNRLDSIAKQFHSFSFFGSCSKQT